MLNIHEVSEAPDILDVLSVQKAYEVLKTHEADDQSHISETPPELMCSVSHKCK